MTSTGDQSSTGGAGRSGGAWPGGGRGRGGRTSGWRPVLLEQQLAGLVGGGGGERCGVGGAEGGGGGAGQLAVGGGGADEEVEVVGVDELEAVHGLRPDEAGGWSGRLGWLAHRTSDCCE